MRIDVISLFPHVFSALLMVGVTRRAFHIHPETPLASEGFTATTETDSASMNLHLWALRDFAQGGYRRVDDRPFGGGPGMLLMPEPLESAIQSVYTQHSTRPPVIHFSPTGQTLTQGLVQELARWPSMILLCGRYEGIDQRFLDRHVDFHVSLGDFVLSGGELPALALLDAMARLQPGVLNDEQSHEQDSFSAGLLEAGAYTRPAHWSVEGETLSVPAILQSGNHQKIQRWQREQALALTLQRRPELIEHAQENKLLSENDRAYLRHLKSTVAREKPP